MANKSIDVNDEQQVPGELFEAYEATFDVDDELEKEPLMLHKPMWLSENPDYGSAAGMVFQLGFLPVPLLPGSVKPAVDIDRWWSNISDQLVDNYWYLFPDHELGIAGLDDCHFVDADDSDELPTEICMPTIIQTEVNW